MPRPTTTSRPGLTGTCACKNSARATGIAVSTAPHSRASGISRDRPSALRRRTEGASPLHEAVADRPGGDEAGDLHILPALRIEEHGQADHEPHIARPEK